MIDQIQSKVIEQFKRDVDQGLSHDPKFLQSKYFYDSTGDDLFIKIMHSPEYYLTRAELEIFQKQVDRIIEVLELEKGNYFELIELGAGDGFKTKELLTVLVDQGYKFDYIPVDISPNVLNKLSKSLAKDLPGLSVQTKQGDYFEILESLKNSKHLKVVLFLGSNIGNMTDDLASQFIYDLGANLNPDDKLLIGADLIKDASIVLPAYSDSKGITRDFNLNLLFRINQELGGNFDLRAFDHFPEYNEETGMVKSSLKSKMDQEVYIESIEKTFQFKKGEMIQTEVSRKYNDKIMYEILKDTDFIISGKLVDSKGYFADYILNRV